MGLIAAQARDDRAGSLSRHDALGGPFYLANEDYYPGINDSLGADPSGEPFAAASMTLFGQWANAGGRDGGGERAEARRAIAAGEALFNSAPMQISNVRGLNDNAAIGSPQSFVGHCTSCHDTPNVGDHSLPLPLDIAPRTPPAPHGERPGHRRRAVRAEHARPAGVPDQRLSESVRARGALLLHDRPGQGAGDRQLQRFQPHQGPACAGWPLAPRTSTTVRPRPSKKPSTSTTSASACT